MKFRRFTKTKFLKEVGRELLGKLFDRFKAELEAKGVSMPPAGADDDAYFAGLAKITGAQDGLPGELIDALFTIEEMANEHGQERLERAARQLGIKLEEDSSHGDIAIQIYLKDPNLLVEQHKELHLSRLSGFEYHGHREPVDRSDSFAVPDAATITRIEADLDDWFSRHNRGEQTAKVEVFSMGTEFWFLIRHGDTYVRKAKVDRRNREILHYRPDKDDVLVYTPERDEIRIHASTKGERELYRTAFGRRLFGDDNHFSERRAYTLKPLLDDGVEALDVTDGDGIERIVLVEVELDFGGKFNEIQVRKADDIFEAAEARGRDAFPPGAELRRAVFEVLFTGAKKPRKVHLRPPNVLKLGRYCDAVAIDQWLTARGFRANAKPKEANVPALAGA